MSSRRTVEVKGEVSRRPNDSRWNDQTAGEPKCPVTRGGGGGQRETNWLFVSHIHKLTKPSIYYYFIPLSGM